MIYNLEGPAATIMDSRVFRQFGCLALTLVIGVLVASTAAACPTCKEGLAHADPAQRALAAGFYYSILFMMSMPFLVLGTFGSFAYFSIRKAQQRSDAVQKLREP